MKFIGGDRRVPDHPRARYLTIRDETGGMTKIPLTLIKAVRKLISSVDFRIPASILRSGENESAKRVFAIITCPIIPRNLNQTIIHYFRIIFDEFLKSLTFLPTNSQIQLDHFPRSFRHPPFLISPVGPTSAFHHLRPESSSRSFFGPTRAFRSLQGSLGVPFSVPSTLFSLFGTLSIFSSILSDSLFLRFSWISFSVLLSA